MNALRIIRSARQMQRVSLRLRRQGRHIGVVPTMGALHAGHASLIRASVRDNDVTIVTIFVNPLQFGPREDFTRYPHPLARDTRMVRSLGADILFLPSAAELYPAGFQTTIDSGPLAARWEGEHRPGHFRGVATIVTILFELTQPTQAYVGQKDYQQVLVIQRLIDDLKLPIRIRMVPTVRGPDGLAMSSRNAYLTPTQRADAVVLFQALWAGRETIRGGVRRASTVLARMRTVIRSAASLRVEYLVIVDANTLEPLRRVQGRTVLLGAVRVGRTRLIDNVLVDAHNTARRRSHAANRLSS